MRISVRLPEDVHQKIVRVAEAERRSLNRQIEVAVRECVARWEASQGAPDAHRS